MALSCLHDGCHRYLLREKLIANDPTLRVENPKLGRPLPDTLTEADVEKLLAAPNIEMPLGPARSYDVRSAVCLWFESQRTDGITTWTAQFASGCDPNCWERLEKNASCHWEKASPG